MLKRSHANQATTVTRVNGIAIACGQKALELATAFNLEDKLVSVESPPDEINRRRLKKTIKPRGAHTQ